MTQEASVKEREYGLHRRKYSNTVSWNLQVLALEKGYPVQGFTVENLKQLIVLNTTMNDDYNDKNNINAI